MSGPRGGRVTQRVLALVLALLALSLGGCVYLRLLELQRQIGKFDRYFAVQSDEGVRILCQEPVVLADDVRWLGLHPAARRRVGVAEQWDVRWEKELPPGMTETGDFSLEVNLTFVEGRLSALTIPERYFKVMPKSFLLGIIRSLGGGKIDRSSRQVESAVTGTTLAEASRKLPAVRKLLGAPTSQRTENGEDVMVYRYRPVTSEGKPPGFEMVLRLEPKSGDLLHWLGRTPIGNIGFDFRGKKA